MTHAVSTRTATAWAGVNIALVKYWGKRDDLQNLPAVGSVSLTLATMGTRTTVTFDPALPADTFELDGQPRQDPRVVATLDALRACQGLTSFARVCSVNHVPTAAGLASSASGTAALASAAWLAAGGDLDAARRDPEFLALVRRGSGSAPRSLLGGLVELRREDGGLVPLVGPDGWSIRMVIARVGRGPKAVSSREGMARTRATSPYYPAWVESHPADLAQARRAIAARDLAGLGAVMERSTMKMHASMLAADPPLRYWRAPTVAVLDVVAELRAAGVGAWATMDAGPHVKILCAAEDVEAVAEGVRQVVPADDVLVQSPGRGAHAC